MADPTILVLVGGCVVTCALGWLLVELSRDLHRVERSNDELGQLVDTLQFELATAKAEALAAEAKASDAERQGRFGHERELALRSLVWEHHFLGALAPENFPAAGCPVCRRALGIGGGAPASAPTASAPTAPDSRPSTSEPR